MRLAVVPATLRDRRDRVQAPGRSGRRLRSSWPASRAVQRRARHAAVRATACTREARLVRSEQLGWRAEFKDGQRSAELGGACRCCSARGATGPPAAQEGFRHVRRRVRSLVVDGGRSGALALVDYVHCPSRRRRRDRRLQGAASSLVLAVATVSQAAAGIRTSTRVETDSVSVTLSASTARTRRLPTEAYALRSAPAATGRALQQ